MYKIIIILSIFITILFFIIFFNKNNIPETCNNSYYGLLSCLKEKKIDPSSLNINESLKNELIKDYYLNLYSDIPNMIKYPAKDKQAIEIKKQILNNMKSRLKFSDCEKLPEEELKEYCLNMFK